MFKNIQVKNVSSEVLPPGIKPYFMTFDPGSSGCLSNKCVTLQ